MFFIALFFKVIVWRIQFAKLFFIFELKYIYFLWAAFCCQTENSLPYRFTGYIYTIIMEKVLSLPALGTERARILDILRGIALFGVCVANYPVLSLYIFQSLEVRSAMPTARLDMIWRFIHLALIDGKFYTLFSLLFGIGFSIILLRCEKSGRNGLSVFYRRIGILILIGLAHILLLWEGDILLLYAILGMMLPLFRNVPDKTLMILIVLFILSPILIDTIKVASGGRWNMSRPLRRLAEAKDASLGITDNNFPTWLLHHKSYPDLLKYNTSGILWRYMDLLDSNRLFKVFGIFLLGFVTGRKMIYTNLEANRVLLRRIKFWGFLAGLPGSIAYAWFNGGQSLPAPAGLLDTVLYSLSVVPLALAYASATALLFLRNPLHSGLKVFAAPGRMALTNYIMQTVMAIVIFYGLGFGWGATMGLVYVVFIAIGIFTLEIVWSHWWLRFFHYGPLEWIWRQLTYGRLFPLKKI